MTTPARPALGLSAIALAILFNVPYVVLAATFDYPDVLRRPPGEVLKLFHEGGTTLILTWHAFALAALALMPLAILLSVTPERLRRAPGLALTAAILGAAAGLTQAMGLGRWVFVIPALAGAHAAPDATEAAREAAERAFVILNQYGGVAIGEHLGQLATALFVLSLAQLQLAEGYRLAAWLGFVTAGAIAVGTTEGLAIALGGQGEVFALTTVAGFLGLTLWLIVTGLGLLNVVRPARAAA